MSMGFPNVGAHVIASVANGAWPVMFAYDEGDLLENGQAAHSPMVAFPFDYGGQRVATDDAWLLFDAAVNWLIAH